MPSWAQVAPEQIEAAEKAGVPVAFENPIGMQFVLIPAGTFTMGFHDRQLPKRSRGCLPPRTVTLTRPFHLQTTEVTNAQFKRFRRGHDSGAFRCRDVVDDDGLPRRECEPSGYAQDRRERPLHLDDQPVVMVGWADASAFVEWLGEEDGAHRYALPTEAQWEYACRAGTTTRFWFGDAISGEEANFNAERNYYGPPGDWRCRTMPVGSFPPNGWGLFDMHGNVWEWCVDGGTRADPEPATDPVTASEGFRAARGGSWCLGAATLMSAWRDVLDERERRFDVGFRVAITVAPK